MVRMTLRQRVLQEDTAAALGVVGAAGAVAVIADAARVEHWKDVTAAAVEHSCLVAAAAADNLVPITSQHER